MSVIHTIGRRKTAVARVFMQPGSGSIQVNNRDWKLYFPLITLQKNIEKPFEVTGTLGQFDIYATIKGGGIRGQSEALQHAIARALEKYNPEFRQNLKPLGLLRRDPRMVERKKPGRPKARKRFQFSKR